MDLRSPIWEAGAQHRVGGNISSYPKEIFSCLLTYAGYSAGHEAWLSQHRLGLGCDLIKTGTSLTALAIISSRQLQNEPTSSESLCFNNICRVCFYRVKFIKAQPVNSSPFTVHGLPESLNEQVTCKRITKLRLKFHSSYVSLYNCLPETFILDLSEVKEINTSCWSSLEAGTPEEANPSETVVSWNSTQKVNQELDPSPHGPFHKPAGCQNLAWEW